MATYRNQARIGLLSETKEAAKKRAVGKVIVTSGDRHKYGNLMIELEDDKIKGFDNYQKFVSEANDIILRNRTPRLL